MVDGGWLTSCRWVLGCVVVGNCICILCMYVCRCVGVYVFYCIATTYVRTGVPTHSMGDGWVSMYSMYSRPGTIALYLLCILLLYARRLGNGNGGRGIGIGIGVSVVRYIGG